MSKWERLGQAVMQGGVAGLDLAADARDRIRTRLREAPEAVRDETVPTLMTWAGDEVPACDPASLTQRAEEAALRLEHGLRAELSARAEEAAGGGAPDAVRREVAWLCRHLPGRLLEDRELRDQLFGAHTGTAARRSGLSLPALLGLCALLVVAGAGLLLSRTPPASAPKPITPVPPPRPAVRALEVAASASAVHAGGPLTIVGRAPGAVRVRVGDARAQVAEDGAFTLRVPLGEERLHALEVVAEADAPPGRGSARLEVRVDRSPPALKLVLPGATWASQLEVPCAVVDASPWVEVEASVAGVSSAQRVRLTPPGGGTLRLTLPRPGSHVVTVRARDAAGNAAAPRTYAITRASPPAALARFLQPDGRLQVDEVLELSPEETLTIPAGVRLELTARAGIACQGVLSVEGTAERPVTLTGEGWRGVSLVGPRARGDLRWVTLEGARSSGNGGGLRVRKGARVSLTDVTIKGCVSARYGGGLYALGSAAYVCRVEATRVTFTGNRASEGGGANLNNYTRSVLSDCRVEGNRAERRAKRGGYGGGLSILGTSQAELSGVTLRENHADRYGGGLYVGGSAVQAQLLSCVLEQNHAAERGGGGYVGGKRHDPPARVTLIEPRLVKNTSAVGAGLNINEYSQVEIRKGTFRENAAARLGGGLIVIGHKTGRSTLVAHDVAFVGNRATSDGGGVNLNNYSSARLVNCRFARNRTRAYGGGLMAIGKQDLPTLLDLIGCAFRFDRARDRQGPALRVHHHVLFDPQLFAANRGLRPSRTSIHPVYRLKRPRPPLVAKELVVGTGPLADGLRRLVAAAISGDWSPLRGVPQRRPSRVTRHEVWEATLRLPEAPRVRLWRFTSKAGEQRCWASATHARDASAATGRLRYDRLVATIRPLLSGDWGEREVVRKNGSRTHTFRAGWLGGAHVEVRVTLSATRRGSKRLQAVVSLVVE